MGEDETSSTSTDVEKSTSNLVMSVEPFVMYKRRWLGLLSIWFLSISTGSVWLTFNAVPQISVRWFHAGQTETNLTVVLYLSGSVVASTFSGFVYEKFGIKKALMLGGLINIVGTWIRYSSVFVESSEESNAGRLAVTLIGQFIAAMAQPFFLNAAPKYAAVWFSDSTRATATSIGSLSNPIAGAIAMSVIPAICRDENGDDMPLTLLIVAIFSIVAFSSTLVISSFPPTPPSASASLALAKGTAEPFWVSFRKTTSNKQFWILLISFSVYVGFFTSFSSLINQIVGPYGYTDDEGGIFGACLILAGIPGAVIAGIFIDKTKQYKTVLWVSSPILTAAFIGLIFVVREDFFAGIAVVCGLLGLSAFSLLPGSLECGIECTYPSPPSSSTSTLWMGGQLCAIFFILMADTLRDDDGDPPGNMRVALISAAVISVLTSIIAFFYNSPNLRLEAEAAAAQKARTVESDV